jgi:hypothetical protein
MFDYALQANLFLDILCFCKYNPARVGRFYMSLCGAMSKNTLNLVVFSYQKILLLFL